MAVPTDDRRAERVVYKVTLADLDAVAGRPVTDDEAQAIGKALRAAGVASILTAPGTTPRSAR